MGAMNISARPGAARLARSARITARARLSLLAACVLAFAGCVFEPKDRSAGVDDFPNSIYARVDGFLDENKKAENLDAASGTDSILIRQSFNGPPVKKMAAPAVAVLPALAKSAAHGAGACPATFTYSDKKAPIGSRVTVDTLIYCMDSTWFDPLKADKHVVRGKSVTRDTVSGRVEIGEFSDGDGDGILNPILGGEAKARILFVIIDKGVTERTRMLIGDGPDDNFDTEPDNLIYEMSWSKTTATDTLGSASFADADSDGIAVDNGKPSLVDISWYNLGPTDDNPDVVWSRLSMRAVVYYKSDRKDMKRFSIESETKDGRTQTAVLLNLDGSRDFDTKDTLLARFRAVGTASADSLDTMETTIRMTTGRDFDAKTDDSTYAFNVRALKKIGEERLAVFDFKSDKPIPSGKEPQLGILTMQVEYTDGTSLEVSGKITDTTVDLTATLRDGKRIHAVWDRSGRGISLEHLN